MALLLRSYHPTSYSPSPTDATWQALLLDAVGGCCNDEHRPRVRSTIGAIFLGDVSSLVLDEALASDGPPPALEQLGKLAELRIPSHLALSRMVTRGMVTRGR